MDFELDVTPYQIENDPMVTDQDATAYNLRHAAFRAVTALSFTGTLDAERDGLPYRMLPGPKPRFRCCIYREREVFRQRLLLAEGKNPTTGKREGPIVQVMESACSECPMGQYKVTELCRRCVNQRCRHSCKFGAITMLGDRAHIDPDKCRECGQCAKACTYNAIIDMTRPCRRACPVGAITYQKETGIVQIDEEKCISCGACIEGCPFGAIGSLTYIADVVAAIRAGKRVVAMVAPSGEGQFGAGISMDSLRVALKELGFADMVEVSLGGDLTAQAEAAEWAEAFEAGQIKTTSCCPAFVSMIRRSYPTLQEHISHTVSPMCAVSRMLKARDPEVVTVFIGPCIAKKDEAASFGIEGNADYVLTFEELRCMFKARNIEPAPVEVSSQEGSIFGKRFASAGGVTAAVLSAMKESGCSENPNVQACQGFAECKKALLMLRAGKLDADFLEGMCCEGGCVGGPSRVDFENSWLKNREALLSQADNRTIGENIRQQTEGTTFSMETK